MRVVLYGNSLFLEGLAESLKAAPELEVLRLRPDKNDLLRQAHRLRPDVVVIEAGALPEPISLGLLKELPGLLLVALDRESSHLLVLSSQETRVLTMADFVRVIESRRDSAAPSTHWQAHHDRLSQVNSRWIAGLHGLPRQRKFAFAVAAITIGAVLALFLSLSSPQANAPLAGAAVGRFAPEMGLAFVGGMLLGALLLALAIVRRPH